MQKRNSLLNGTGSALVFALVIGTVFAIMGISALSLMRRGNEMLTRDVEVIKSYWADESALNLGFRYVSRTINPPVADVAPLVLSPALQVNGYLPIINITVSGPLVYSMTAWDTLKGLSVINRSSTSQTAITQFGFYTFFMNDDLTDGFFFNEFWDGNFHSNGKLRIWHDMPLHTPGGFHNTGNFTVAGKYFGGAGDDFPNYPVPFRNGMARVNGNTGSEITSAPPAGWLESRFKNYSFTGKIPIDPLMPNTGELATGYNLSPAGSPDVRIRFTGLAATPVEVSQGSGSTRTWAVDPALTLAANTSLLSGNHILTVNQHTYVEGTVNGNITITTTSSKSIFISDDIYYADTNMTTSQDNLVMVSDADVSLPCEALGGGNIVDRGGSNLDNVLRVFGQLYAPKGQFSLQNVPGWREYQTPTFKISGSVMQKSDGWRGQISGGAPYKGLAAENYHFDPRLNDNSVTSYGLPRGARQVDNEMTVINGASTLMWSFNIGVWANILTQSGQSH